MSPAEGTKARRRPRRKVPAIEAVDLRAPAPAMLLSVLDFMLARIAIVDRRRRFRYVNPAYAEALALMPREIIGRSVAEVRGRVHARRMAPHARAALEGRTTRWEGWYDDPQLGRSYYDTLYAPMQVDSEVVGLVVLIRDLTALKRREQELTARTAQLEAILSGIADGVTISDSEERLVLCNAGFVAMFDAPEELVQPGVPREAFVRYRLARGNLYPSERPGDAPERLVAERTARVRAAAGGVLAEDIEVFGRYLHARRCELADGTSVTTYTDVTGRKEAEQARQRQHDALRETQQLGTIAALLAGFAHELKNPLSMVAAHATVLQEEAAGTRLAARAEAVHAAARRCGRIVDSLMSSIRHRTPKREPVTVPEVLLMALDLVDHRLRGTGIEVSTAIPSDLPSLNADPDQLVHLLANLLGNAAAALEDRPGLTRIHVAAGIELTNARRSLVLRVADNGPGIPPALRERVFEPFFTTKPDGAGTGIGLVLCRSIVEDHGGRIVAEETPDGGATFVVRLPCHGD